MGKAIGDSLPLATGTAIIPVPVIAVAPGEPRALPAGPAEMARILLSLTRPQPHL